MHINSLREKLISLRETCLKSSIDILCADEIKLDVSCPSAQFRVDRYQLPPSRGDRNKHGGGKMVFVRSGVLVKITESLEGKDNETICMEVTISKNKCCIMFAYRPSQNNKEMFFNELIFFQINVSINMIISLCAAMTLTYLMKENITIISCQIFLTLLLCKI